MKLYHPVDPPIINQEFEENATSFYKDNGMKGHGALDYRAKFGQDLLSSIEAEVYSIKNKDHSDLMRYRAVYQIHDDIDFSYEISYGHCNEIFVQVGDVPRVGKLIATAGNTGDVFSNGKYITKEEKEKGSTAGTHLHFQVRKCIRVKKTSSGKSYLQNSSGKLKRNGYYYEIVNYDNGYKGCVDPEPFFNGTQPLFQFTKDLKKGKSYEAEVVALQKFLIAVGYLLQVPDTELGYYGPKTAEAVFKFQSDYIGMTTSEKKLKGSQFGPKSRAAANEVVKTKKIIL